MPGAGLPKEWIRGRVVANLLHRHRVPNTFNDTAVVGARDHEGVENFSCSSKSFFMTQRERGGMYVFLVQSCWVRLQVLPARVRPPMFAGSATLSSPSIVRACTKIAPSVNPLEYHRKHENKVCLEIRVDSRSTSEKNLCRRMKPNQALHTLTLCMHSSSRVVLVNNDRVLVYYFI